MSLLDKLSQEYILWVNNNHSNNNSISCQLPNWDILSNKKNFFLKLMEKWIVDGRLSLLSLLQLIHRNRKKGITQHTQDIRLIKNNVKKDTFGPSKHYHDNYTKLLINMLRAICKKINQLLLKYFPYIMWHKSKTFFLDMKR